MESYPFLEYINEDKSRYVHAKDAGYIDDDDLFLIGDSGGFLLNINPNVKFINTELFSPMGAAYKKNKTYTSYKVDSIPHRQLRKREQYRRLHGMTAPCMINEDGEIVNVRITGNHYNFLNYNRMEQLDERTIKVGKVNTAKKYYDFPKFIDAQFWFWHIVEFAEKNGFHLLIDKTRRGGFSYMMASDSSNRVNCQSRKVVIHVAADKKYLTATGGLTDFAVNNIKFYEENTPFVRGIVSSVKSDFRLGYKLPSGIEADKSWRSSLLSVSANNNPDCAIGKDAVAVKVEEVSTMENFDEFMEVTEPAMRTGGYTTGILMAWGTATSGNMQIFEQNFYNPKAFGFMPFENVWDKDCRNEICGFFKPYCWGLQGEINGLKGVDQYGNSNIEVGLAIALKERKVKRETAKTYSDYINYLGQYALSPNESFSSTSENIFSSEELTKWEDTLRMDSDKHFHVDGMLEENNGRIEFKSNKRLVSEGKKVYDWIQGVPRKGNEDPHGCIRRWFAPEYVEEQHDGYSEIPRKAIPEGLYSITYDPVGVDKVKNEITNRHSHNSIKVWMNPHWCNGYKQKLVAAYYGRPDSLEEADYICYMLAKYYNCIRTTNVETNRGETVSNFKKWKALKYLAYEPLYVWDPSLKEKVSSSYGYNIGTSNKPDALRLLKEFLYEEIGKDADGNVIRNFHNIYDYQSILELKKWNNIGNFDRVSEMILRGIEWKARKLKSMNELQSRKKINTENGDDFFNRPWF